MPSWWGIGELADVGFVAKTCLTMSTIDGELSARSRRSSTSAKRMTDSARHASLMKPAYPQCHQAVEYSLRGGLLLAKCEHCDWEITGTANIPMLPPGAPVPPMVASTVVKPSAEALKAVRETFTETRQMPLHVLAERLCSPDGLLVGTLQSIRLAEVGPQLLSLDVELRRAAHEEDR
jgi:hypothetical protein